MITVTIFAISGLAIPILIIAKRLEQKRKKTFLIFNFISKSNIHIRKLFHRMVHYYSEGKERLLFFFKKRIPMHFKNSSNKLVTFLLEKKVKYITNMRDSRLLKKSDGISEFFKNMSSIEKGNGEIHDVYEESSQDMDEKIK